MLKAINVAKKWPDGTIALEDISFEAAPGTLTSIIGPSGAGKTSLLRIISGLETADGGQIDNSHGQVGMVFQESSLWPHLTLLENVSLPLERLRGFTKSHAKKQAEEVLSAWGLESRLHAYPAELSGGQQQRGAIARALVMETKVLCLDEVTSALDPESSVETFRTLLSSKSKDVILLMATHQLGFIRERADQVIFLDHGRIIEIGSANDVLLNPKEKRTQAFVSAAMM